MPQWASGKWVESKRGGVLWCQQGSGGESGRAERCWGREGGRVIWFWPADTKGKASGGSQASGSFP